MTATQTSVTKKALELQTGRGFKAIEKTYNNRRKIPNSGLPSLMLNGFVHPIAYQKVMDIYTALDSKTPANVREDTDNDSGPGVNLDAPGENPPTPAPKPKRKPNITPNTEGVAVEQKASEQPQKEPSALTRFLKSDIFTITFLVFSVAYQGYHSQQFFADRHIIGNDTGKDDIINVTASTVAAVAFSIVGLKLTLHTKNLIWLYSVAVLEILIYMSTKELTFANGLAGTATALSIVAYNHILNE